MEQIDIDEEGTRLVCTDDESYAKSVLGGSSDPRCEEQKVLGVHWTLYTTNLSFIAATLEPTKRNVVGLSTDSKVILYQIKGLTIEWKQFIQNRVEEIRRLLSIKCWQHCPEVSNPADIPSRGSQPSDLISNPLWCNGPEVVDCEEVLVEQVPIPDKCLRWS